MIKAVFVPLRVTMPSAITRAIGPYETHTIIERRWELEETLEARQTAQQDDLDRQLANGFTIVASNVITQDDHEGIYYTLHKV